MSTALVEPVVPVQRERPSRSSPLTVSPYTMLLRLQVEYQLTHMLSRLQAGTLRSCLPPQRLESRRVN